MPVFNKRRNDIVVYKGRKWKILDVTSPNAEYPTYTLVSNDPFGGRVIEFGVSAYRCEERSEHAGLVNLSKVI